VESPRGAWTTTSRCRRSSKAPTSPESPAASQRTTTDGGLIHASLSPLSVGLVLATALLVGVGVDLFVPGVSLAAAIALGAAVAPPDPVAALAIGRRAGLPANLATLSRVRPATRPL
jgi:hypothetical protein